MNPSGDTIANDLAQERMLQIADELTPVWASPRDGDYLAVQATTPNPRWRDGTVVEALSWSGNSAISSGGAVIELRISVHVDAKYARTFGDTSHGEGDSVRCWEIRVFARNYDEYELHEIGCPDDPAPPLPTPTPLPTMPVDVDQRLTATLAAATAEDLSDRLAAEFADERVTIDAIAEGGMLIAAIGEWESDDCVVGVRHADGVVELLRGWPWEWLQSGETGCSVGLYLNPPE